MWETETDRETETERQRLGQSVRYTQMWTAAAADRRTEIRRDKVRNMQCDKKADRQTDKQANIDL